jgi:hypothetical protein
MGKDHSTPALDLGPSVLRQVEIALSKIKVGEDDPAILLGWQDGAVDQFVDARSPAGSYPIAGIRVWR